MKKFIALVGLTIVMTILFAGFSSLYDDDATTISDDRTTLYNSQLRCGWSEKRDGYYIVLEDASDYSPEELELHHLSPTFQSVIKFHDNYEYMMTWLGWMGRI